MALLMRPQMKEVVRVLSHFGFFPAKRKKKNVLAQPCGQKPAIVYGTIL